MQKPIPTGVHLENARLTDLRAVLRTLSPEDIAVLDPALIDRARTRMGREALAAVGLGTLGSVFVGLLSVEPAGLIVVERGHRAGRIRLLCVSPDFRRRGVGRALVAGTADNVALRGLSAMWMSVPSANSIATRFALASGFQRYRAQYLHRSGAGSWPARNPACRLKQLPVNQCAAVLKDAIIQGAIDGDEWAADYVREDLMPGLLPTAGTTWHCYVGNTIVGVAHLGVPAGHPVVSLWLEREIWGVADLEFGLLREVLAESRLMPNSLDINLGSFDHLKASLPLYKSHGFLPQQRERVTFIQPMRLDGTA